MPELGDARWDRQRRSALVARRDRRTVRVLGNEQRERSRRVVWAPARRATGSARLSESGGRTEHKPGRVAWKPLPAEHALWAQTPNAGVGVAGRVGTVPILGLRELREPTGELVVGNDVLAAALHDHRMLCVFQMHHGRGVGLEISVLHRFWASAEVPLIVEPDAIERDDVRPPI